MILPAQIVDAMLAHITELDACEKDLEVALTTEYHTKVNLQRATAIAYRTIEGSNREYRKAMVDEAVIKEWEKAEEATVEAKLAYQRMLNKRQALSALQSAARSVTEEAALARVGPADLVNQERYGGL